MKEKEKYKLSDIIIIAEKKKKRPSLNNIRINSKPKTPNKIVRNNTDQDFKNNGQNYSIDDDCKNIVEKNDTDQDFKKKSKNNIIDQKVKEIINNRIDQGTKKIISINTLDQGCEKIVKKNNYNKECKEIFKNSNSDQNSKKINVNSNSIGADKKVCSLHEEVNYDDTYTYCKIQGKRNDYGNVNKKCDNECSLINKQRKNRTNFVDDDKNTSFINFDNIEIKNNDERNFDISNDIKNQRKVKDESLFLKQKIGALDMKVDKMGHVADKIEASEINEKNPTNSIIYTLGINLKHEDEFIFGGVCDKKLIINDTQFEKIQPPFNCEIMNNKKNPIFEQNKQDQIIQNVENPFESAYNRFRNDKNDKNFILHNQNLNIVSDLFENDDNYLQRLDLDTKHIKNIEDDKNLIILNKEFKYNQKFNSSYTKAYFNNNVEQSKNESNLIVDTKNYCYYTENENKLNYIVNESKLNYIANENKLNCIANAKYSKLAANENNCKYITDINSSQYKENENYYNYIENENNFKGISDENNFLYERIKDETKLINNFDIEENQKPIFSGDIKNYNDKIDSFYENHKKGRNLSDSFFLLNDKNVNKELTDIKNDNFDELKYKKFSSFINLENDKLQQSSFLSTNTEQSTSILELPWLIQSPQIKYESVFISKKILPAFHDPIFLDYVFEIPKSLEHILKKQKHLNFTYQATFSDKITIKKNDITILKGSVVFYGSELLCTENFMFIINRKKFVKKENLKESIKYRKCLATGSLYTENRSLQEDLTTEIFMHQIQNKTNIFFIDSYNDLLNVFKSIVKFNDFKKDYIPKIKTFNSTNKQEFLISIVSKIPGISKNVAMAIGETYGSFKNFFDFLIIEKGRLSELIIKSDDKKSERKLGEKQTELLKKAF
ncbi:hypothetical protein COBT_001734, partial [Conglomerata obtusa]